MANPIKFIELAVKAAEMSLIRGKKFNDWIPEFCVGPLSTKKKKNENSASLLRGACQERMSLSLSPDRQSH